MLTVGQSLPAFKGQALLPNGEFGDISLADYRGKWVVLFFYPLDFTFVCPTEIRGYNKLNAEFKKLNTVVLGASVDSVHSHKAWVANGLGKLDFPLIGDLKHELSQACGILSPEGFANRATFIVDPNGIIRYVAVNDLKVGRNVDEVLRTLDALQTDELCQCGWTPGEDTLTKKAA